MNLPTEQKILITNAIGEEKTSTIGELMVNPYYSYIWHAFECELMHLVARRTQSFKFNNTKYELA